MKNPMIYYPESLSEKIGFTLVLRETLKKTYSPYGREELRDQTGTSNPDELQELLEMAREWMSILESEGTYPLTQTDDVREVLKDSKIEGSVLPLEAFPIVQSNARLARLIIRFFEKSEKEYSTLLQYVKKLTNLRDLEKEIEKVVTDNGLLRDDASQKLKSIRGKINRRKGQLRSTINNIMKRARKDGMTSDEGPTIRNGRMVIPIQAEFKRKVDGFVHDVSQPAKPYM